MKCPKCQAENPPDFNFCPKCVQNLRVSLEVTPTDYSKPHSNTPKFLIDKVLTTRSAIEGEYQSITVPFAYVANYTGIRDE